MKQLVVFDLDGTLAASKSPLSSEIAHLLRLLLTVTRVAVISGGSWTQFETQLLTSLTHDCRLENLFLLPTCGTKFFHFDDEWVMDYSEDLTRSERTTIVTALTRALEESGVKVAKVWGDVIEDRGSQVTLSALGQEAPLSAKGQWDPDFAKRTKIVTILTTLLQGFAINMGGTSSIDVTKPGIDKAYGIEKLRAHLGIEIAQMLFVGDAIFEGGNDFAAQRVGVDSILVRDPRETARVIQTIIACLGDGATQMVAPAHAS
ncbi:MAG TPA: HAD-IIB family hydrolase [Acidimicrobiales bacterium]|nr:MAG: HAD family hydrolase [Actinobacteria bacterium 21-64-8]HQT99516.1 HAD-IIB family hydrolase [Acidimicrobiales bacterium]